MEVRCGEGGGRARGARGAVRTVADGDEVGEVEGSREEG